MYKKIVGITAGFATVAALGAADANAQWWWNRLRGNVNVHGDVHVQADVELLTRGPVHEAFAAPVVLEPEPALRVTRPPPPPIDELPPSEIPDGSGDEVQWVPGYWAWDEDRNDYIWVSGVWRTPPPGSSWIPGYWSDTGSGYEYASGAWVPEDEDEIEYLPPPPRTLEEGPVGNPPSQNHVWVAGSWYWEDSWDWTVNAQYDSRSGAHVQINSPRQAGYVWRPGYWMVCHPSWIWTPAHYVWTPRGCVFVAGYWDYPLEQRGVLFTPVYFPPAVAVRHVRYSPTIAINVGALSLNLFTRPRVTQYYFGDYYDRRYVSVGYTPFYEVHYHNYSYDPLFVHLSWRAGPDRDRWVTDLRRGYEYRREHVDARPALTYREQRERFGRSVRSDGRSDDRDRRSLAIARPVTEVASQDDGPRVSRLNDDRRQAYTQRSRELQSFGDQRRNWETSAAVQAPRREPDRDARPAAPSRDAQPAAPNRDARPATPDRPTVSTDRKPAERVKIQRSPVSSRSPEARNRVPQRPSAPDRPEPKKLKGQKRDKDKDDRGERRPERKPRERDDDDDDGD